MNTLGLLLMTLFGVGAWVSAAEAETRIIEQVEGKGASLELLKKAMKKPAGRFCGGQLAVLDVRVDARGAVTTEIRSQSAVEASQIMKLARTLPSDRSVIALYCRGSGDQQVSTGTTVTHLVFKQAHSWTGSTIATGESLPPSTSAEADTPTDAEIEKALVEAARQINENVPMIVDKNLRLDRVDGGNRTLLYRYTLFHHNASAVNAEEFRRGMQAILVGEICTDEEMAVLLVHGVAYSYRYQSKDGKHIVTISVRSSDCD